MRKRFRQLLTRRAAILGVSALCCTGARAGALQVAPVRLELPPGADAAALTLRNEGNTPLTGQIRVFKWTQQADADQLEATADVVASPPIVEIAPHSEQLVRIVRVRADAPHVEESYRLLVDEIPPDAEAASNAVRIRLRYSVPMFIAAPRAKKRPTPLSFKLVHTEQAGWNLRATNDGARHAQLGHVMLEWHGGQHSTLARGLLGYTLAHSSRAWPLKMPPPGAVGGQAMLHATVNGVPIAVPIDISSRQAAQGAAATARQSGLATPIVR